MINPTIGHARLISQQIHAPSATAPAEVVSSLGAMQAQDYLGALWAIGLRLARSSRPTEAAVEAAVADGSIVRTWPLRGTLHFVAAADVRWILDLLGPRALSQAAGRRRELGIEDEDIATSLECVARALEGGRTLTRAELFAALRGAGVATEGQRGVYILSTLAQSGFLCFATRRGKEFTFALLDEWVPAQHQVPRDEALAELALRYFVGHGPATVKDFARWAGITLGDARAGAAGASATLARESIEGVEYCFSAEGVAALVEGSNASADAYLLPGFDEFLLGYASRSAVLNPEDEMRVHPGANGVFSGTIVAGGLVEGTWRRTLGARRVQVAVSPFTQISAERREAVVASAERYGQYLGLAAQVEWRDG